MPVAGFRPYTGRRAQTYERQRAAQPEWTREREIIVAAVATMPNAATVLDVPVGTGRFLPLYAERDLRVTGVDLSPDMLAEARRKATGARLLCGDVTKDLLQVLGGFVDYAVCVRLLNWLTPAEAELAIGQLLRVTRTAVWVGLWSADTAGQPAASAETQAEDDVTRWLTTSGWYVADRHILAAGARTHAVWELRRAAR
jgi:SAM-dependent methyltransferase